MSDSLPPTSTQLLPRFKWPKWFITFGIVVPLIALTVEVFWGLCGAVFFDPVPDAWHGLLLLLVPVSYAIVYRATTKGVSMSPTHIAFLLGAAGVVATYYCIACLWISGFSVPALVMIPYGFAEMMRNGRAESLVFASLPILGISPFLAWCAWFSAFGKLKRHHRDAGINLKTPLYRGAFVCITTITLLETPTVITRLSLKDAANHHSPYHQSALTAIRWVGDTSLVHRACYQQGESALEIAGWMMEGGPVLFVFRHGPSWQVEPTKARELYYRLTGKLFSDVPPKHGHIARSPLSREFRDGAATADEWAWDGERGSSDVGARLQGLSLANSDLQWHVESTAGLAYGEWTMEFQNQHANPQEARCQVLLPPGGTVSRLTLWVNGEPREAAFDARSKVTAAYQQVVKVERRDPVLVNMVGPDRILVQCFPVPAAGGKMKIRLGITTPVDTSTQSRLWMPQFLERNFNVPGAVRHHLSLNSSGVSTNTHTQADAVKQDVATTELATTSFLFDAKSLAPRVWTEDKLGDPKLGTYLVRETASTATKPWPEVVCVIDTSAGLAEYRRALLDALINLPPDIKLTVLLPDDRSFKIVDRSGLSAGFNDVGFIGGRDNTSAMVEAIKLTQKSPQSCLLWVHGAQPLKFDGAELGTPSGEPITVYSLPMRAGPNRVLEQLYRLANVQSIPMHGEQTQLKQVVHQLITAPTRSSYLFTRSATPPTEAIPKVSDQLARHWALTEVMSHFRGVNDVPSEQAALASRYQIVSPYSGAVVLETQEQYDRAGLKPVDGSMTPKLPGSTPEPSAIFLILSGLSCLAFQRRR